VGRQPHRTRYRRTARRGARFKERAGKVLWCSANAERLARVGPWVVCADAIPNLRVLERGPPRRAIPGHLERPAFAYVRHGTVNLLLSLAVHSGRMAPAVLGANDAAHSIPALRRFRRRHRRLKGVFLLHAGGASPIAGATADYLGGGAGRWRPRLTPAHASWLNQAELRVGAFGGRYLRRGSWAPRGEFISQGLAAGEEYNDRYAHPLKWTWTNDQMRRWYAEHAPSIFAGLRSRATRGGRLGG
jgi:hypothetical protein